jgi:hypothetical protein
MSRQVETVHTSLFRVSTVEASTQERICIAWWAADLKVQFPEKTNTLTRKGILSRDSQHWIILVLWLCSCMVACVLVLQHVECWGSYPLWYRRWRSSIWLPCGFSMKPGRTPPGQFGLSFMTVIEAKVESHDIHRIYILFTLLTIVD